MQAKAFIIIVITDNAIIVIKYSERRNEMNHSFIKFCFMAMGAKLCLFKTNLTKSSEGSTLGFSILYLENRVRKTIRYN